MTDKDGQIQYQARQVQVDSERAGQRLDNFLFSQLKSIPKSAIYKMIRRGEVRVNKGRAKPETRLNDGDFVRLPPVKQDVVAPVIVPRARMTQISQRILYEDKDILVVNKPSGVAVHGGSGLSFGIIELLRELYPKCDLSLVHRLDRETSGCLVIAKRRSALRRLHEHFREGTVEKTYLALVKGCWDKGVFRSRQPLLKNVMRSGERMVQVDERGKASETVFEPKKIWANASLIQAMPVTGRTHQIRVHAAALGYPLAGDGKYGDEGFNRTMAQHSLERLFLHAARIKLPRGADEPLIVDSPLDDDLAAVVANLNKKAASSE